MKKAERFEEEMVELVVEEEEMAAQHLVEVDDLIEEEQALWDGEEDLVEEEQLLCDEEEDPYEMEQVQWLTDYEDYVYLVGGSAFHMMEAEVLRLVEEAIEEIAEEWEED